MDRLRRRRARHLIGYGSTPVLVLPGKDGYPRWEIRDPLSTFAGASAPDDLTPPDCIFTLRRSLRWLQINYPTLTPKLSRRPEWSWDDKIEVVQYVDAEQITMIAVGQLNSEGTNNHVTLTTAPNLAGCPLVVIPGRITLDRLQVRPDDRHTRPGALGAAIPRRPTHLR
jgi:hypothetical protein